MRARSWGQHNAFVKVDAVLAQSTCRARTGRSPGGEARPRRHRRDKAAIHRSSRPRAHARARGAPRASRVPDAALAAPSVGPPVVPGFGSFARASLRGVIRARRPCARGGAAVAALRERFARRPRASAALAFPSRRPSRASSTARRAPLPSAPTRPPPTRRPPRRRGRARSATSPRRRRELRAILVDPDRLVRARSRGHGARRGPGVAPARDAPRRARRAPRGHRVVKYDQRRAFTSNAAYPRAVHPAVLRDRREEASAARAPPRSRRRTRRSRAGSRVHRVETEEEVLQLA